MMEHPHTVCPNTGAMVFTTPGHVEADRQRVGALESEIAWLKEALAHLLPDGSQKLPKQPG